MAGDVSGVKLNLDNILKPTFDFFGKFVDLIPNPNEKAKLIAEQQKIQADLEKMGIELESKIQDQLTERLRIDSQGSWLTKNIRPLALIHFMVIFDFAFFGHVEPAKLTILADFLIWIFSFYFGGRSIEKSTGIISKISERFKK